MSRGRSVQDWRRAVFGARGLPDSTRVLLLHLADKMKADRTVSVPRERVAEHLGVSERRISERVTSAHEVGFLVTLTRGQKGVTAVYQGTWPDKFSETTTRPLKSAQGDGNPLAEQVGNPPPEDPFSGTPVGPTSSTRPPQSVVTVAGNNREAAAEPDRNGSRSVFSQVPQPVPIGKTGGTRTTATAPASAASRTDRAREPHRPTTEETA